MITKEIYNVLQNQSYTYSFFIGNPISNFSFTPYSGVNFSVGTLSHNNGSFVNTINTPTEIGGVNQGNGWYQIVLNASEMTGNQIILVLSGTKSGTNVYDSVLLHLVSSLPTTLDSSILNINSISEANPTLQEVLSMIWIAMSSQANKKGWDFDTWKKEFNF